MFLKYITEFSTRECCQDTWACSNKVGKHPIYGMMGLWKIPGHSICFLLAELASCMGTEYDLNISSF
jgi:hypothetical protein